MDNLFYIHRQPDGNISIPAGGDELKPIPESFLRPILAQLAEEHGAAGASLNSRGDHGLTALGFAEQNEHEEAAALIRTAGEK